MKRLFVILLPFMALSCMEKVEDDRVSSIVPYPNEIRVEDGFFSARGAAVNYTSQVDEASRGVIISFAKKLSQVCGTECPVAENDMPQGGISFMFNELVPQEAYAVDVTTDRVLVQASDLRGFNYAVQTIKQLLPVEIFGNTPAPRADWTIPCVHIDDAPRFAYRGLHLDEARHFFGIEQVKKYLDIMEVHKLNKFHWHLTDDQGWRIEIKKYPLLTQVGSKRKGTCVKRDFTSTDGVPYGEGMWYTQEQIREVVAYAAAKGIDVIPEIDLPGHMVAALAAYPELGCTGGPYEVWTRWGISEDVLCAGNDKVYEFLKDVLAEICELFPYEYIHIGGDECPKVRWKTCPKCQAKIKSLGLKDTGKHKAEHYLQSHVMTVMEKFLNEKGRNIIGWDEILEGEAAPNATIMSWRGEKGGIEATGLGHRAIMTPNTYFYLDYYQSSDIANEPFAIGGHLPVERCYSYEPYAEGMTPEQCGLIWGVQANLWTEYIAEGWHLEYMLLPRLAALSEVQWCRKDRKDWNRFFEAADRFCAMYETMGYEYADHILQVFGKVRTDAENRCAVVELHAQDGVPVKYTLDGSTPGRFSRLYKEPVVVSESCQMKAVALRDGVQPKMFVRKFDFHKATGKGVSFSREPHASYSAGGPAALTDGVRGPVIHKSIEWLAWHGKPVDIIVDMGEKVALESVSVGFLSNKPSHIFLPQGMSVSVSEDGNEYTEVASGSYGVEAKDAADSVSDLTLSFGETQARYVKINVVPVESLPEWHVAAGKRVFVFVDEVVVR